MPEKQDPRLFEESKARRHEVRDFDARLAGRATALFFIFTLASIVIATGVFWAFDAQMMKPREPRPATVPPPNFPVLQNNQTAKTDIRDLRLREREQTERVGWVDRATGTVRIPVEKAMEDVLREGLIPTRPSEPLREPSAPAMTTRLSPPVDTAPRGGSM